MPLVQGHWWWGNPLWLLHTFLFQETWSQCTSPPPGKYGHVSSFAKEIWARMMFHFLVETLKVRVQLVIVSSWEWEIYEYPGDTFKNEASINLDLWDPHLFTCFGHVAWTRTKLATCKVIVIWGLFEQFNLHFAQNRKE